LRSFKIFIKNNKWNIIILTAITMLMVFVSLYVSKYTKIFFDEGFVNNNISIIKESIFLLMGLYIGLFFLNLIQNYESVKFLYNGMLAIRKEIFKKVLNTDYSYFVNNPTGKIWGEIYTPPNRVGIFYTSLIFLPADIVEAFVYTYIIYKASIVGGIILSLFIPFLILISYYTGKKIRKYEQKMLDSYRAMMGNAMDILSMAKIIKTNNNDDYFLNIFKKNHEDMNNAAISTNVLTTLWENIILIVTAFSPLIIIYYGNTHMSSFKLTQGELIVIYIFSPLFFNSYKKIYKKFLDFYGVKPYIKTIEEHLGLEDEKLGENKLNKGNLEIHNFEYNYGNKKVKIPDIKVNKGEKILILGESGRGKSTMFNAIIGILKDYKGVIKIGNEDIKNIDIEDLRKKVKLVHQEGYVFNGTLKENILMELNNVSEEEYKKILKILKLEKLEKEKDGIINKDKISGGEKARINLAQVLLRKPEMLLLDETLSSVDEEMEKEILQEIIKAYPDMTILMITHRKSIAKFFDKIIEL